MNPFIDNQYYTQHIIASFVIFIALIAIRFLVIKQISQLKITPAETKRSITVKVKNVFIVIIFFSLVTIWSSELKTIALSLVAIAAAVAIATKEFTLCFIGGLYKWISKPFSVGDRIEVDKYRGEVADYKFLTTTLLEIGPGKELSQYTGRILVLPNSIYLASSIARESHADKYILHSFLVPISSKENWQKCETHLLLAAIDTCKPYIEDAKNYFNSEKHFFVLGPVSIEPRVMISIPNPEQIDFIIRVPCPSMQTNKIQQSIIRGYLELQAKENHQNDEARSGASIYQA